MELNIRSFSPQILFASAEAPQSNLAIGKLSVDIVGKGTPAVHECYPDLLLSGSGSLSRQEILESLQSIGMELNVSITNAIVTIEFRVTAQNLQKGLHLVKRILTEPRFDKKEISRCKKSTRNSLLIFKEHARAQALLSLKNALFDKDNRRHEIPTSKLIHELDDVTQSALISFHEEIMTLPWMISAGGSNKTIESIARSLTRLHRKSTDILVQTPTQRAVPKPALLTSQHIPSKHNLEFSIGKHISLSMLDDTFPDLIVGTAILGLWGGFAGRLMSTIREQEGLTYGIYAQIEGVTCTENGYLRIMTFFSPEETIRGLTSTFREVSNIYKNGITKDELERFKVILKTRQALIFDSLVHSTNHVHQLMSRGFSLEMYSHFQERLAHTSTESVTVSCREYLDPHTLTISMAGPTKALESSIKTFITKPDFG